MSTVTPLTITMTPHGIRRSDSRSSAHRKQHKERRASKGAHADIDVKEDHGHSACADNGSVIQCSRSRRLTAGKVGHGRLGRWVGRDPNRLNPPNRSSRQGYQGVRYEIVQ